MGIVPGGSARFTPKLFDQSLFAERFRSSSNALKNGAGRVFDSFPHTQHHVRPHLLRFRRQGRRAQPRRAPRVLQARRRQGPGEHVAGTSPPVHRSSLSFFRSRLISRMSTVESIASVRGRTLNAAFSSLPDLCRSPAPTPARPTRTWRLPSGTTTSCPWRRLPSTR